MIIEGWQVNNFLTLFILVMILAFQRRGSRVKTSRMFTYIIITTIVLVVADTFARIGENRGGSFILMAFFGNLIMFLVDPLIILFSVIYIDCWMDEKNKKARKILKIVFHIFATLNVVLVLADQVLRSGTSIGANVAEAECSISKKDFLAKMYIAYKESGETLFWLRALHDSNKLTDSQFESINNDCIELNKMLASITKTTRENIEQEAHK